MIDVISSMAICPSAPNIQVIKAKGRSGRWTGYVGGALIEEENKKILDAFADNDKELLAMRGHYEELTLDPLEVMQVENQYSQGACQGHAISSVVEWVHYAFLGDTSLQLSRAMAYYETQRIDGLRGDKGSTISGGVKLATDTGICKEDLWPYPSRYDPSRPRDYEKILEDAKSHQVMNATRLRSYDLVRTYLGSGQGAITIGISWGSGMNSAVVERFSPGGGGHAIGLFCLSNRKDSQGRPYVWMMNSWGTGFGRKGWSEWSPTAVDQMFKARWTVAFGISDLKNATPRRFTRSLWKKSVLAL